MSRIKNHMTVKIFPDYETMSFASARVIAGRVKASPALSLCVATGYSPARTYELLAASRKKERLKFDRVTVIKLDEWAGIPIDNPETCDSYTHKYLIKPLDIRESRYIAFDSNPVNPEKECIRIRRLLREVGGINLCVLGLGSNGHVGFNEPARRLIPRAHFQKLRKSTLSHSMVRHSSQNIRYGFTLGMKDIMEADEILLLVSGRNKARQLKRALGGKVSPLFPASFLQQHSNVVVMCDEDAASLL